MVIWYAHDPLAKSPGSLHFWGMISLATIVGGFAAYPINHWLVAKKLKHGMMTVRKNEPMHMDPTQEKEHMHMHHSKEKTAQPRIKKALIGSLIALGTGIAIAIIGA